MFYFGFEVFAWNQVKGMAINKGMRLGPREERESAGPCIRLVGFFDYLYVPFF